MTTIITTPLVSEVFAFQRERPGGHQEDIT